MFSAAKSKQALALLERELPKAQRRGAMLIYRQARKLPPGHVMTLERGRGPRLGGHLIAWTSPGNVPRPTLGGRDGGRSAGRAWDPKANKEMLRSAGASGP